MEHPGTQFLTPPKQHQYEIRCYIRDLDGYIIEVGQTTDPQGDWWPADWPPIKPRRAIRLNPVSSMSGTLGWSEVVPLPQPRPVVVTLVAPS